MEATHSRITLRSMLTAVFWLSACLACWAAPGAIDQPWAPAAGWLALCTGVAALFGDAIRFAIVAGTAMCLLFFGMLATAGLATLVPEPAAVIAGMLFSAAAAICFVRWIKRRGLKKSA
jgi:hypothetical protein